MSADFYAYHPLPIEADNTVFFDLARKIEADGAKHARFTIINDEHPSETHPHGCYAEGWLARPEGPDPIPFEFPLSEVTA